MFTSTDICLPKTKKNRLSFPAPFAKEITIAAKELEKVIEILISDSRYADVGLHDRPEAAAICAAAICDLVRPSKTGSPKSVFKMFTLMKNYSSCHGQRRAMPKPQSKPKPNLGPTTRQPSEQPTTSPQQPSQQPSNSRLACRAVALWACQRSTRPNSSQLMMDVDYDGRCRPTKKNNQQHMKMNRSSEDRQKRLPAICQGGAAQRKI